MRQAALTDALYATDVNRPVEIWAAEGKRLVTWLSRRLDRAQLLAVGRVVYGQLAAADAAAK